MTRAIVTVEDLQRAMFATETVESWCAVFSWHGGVPARAGDILEGPVLAGGRQRLRHGQGVCLAVGLSGPVSRSQALAWLGRSSLVRATVTH